MSNYKHGYSKTKLYGVWNAMKARCNNPNSTAYANYGGRGITVCAEWESFENFLRDMGEPPSGMTLDRVDNEKGYFPENCRWASRKTQGKNRRGRRILKVGDKEMPMADWARYAGLTVATLWRRIETGWSPAEAVSTPLITQRKGIKRGEKLREYAASPCKGEAV